LPGSTSVITLWSIKACLVSWTFDILVLIMDLAEIVACSNLNRTKRQKEMDTIYAVCHHDIPTLVNGPASCNACSVATERTRYVSGYARATFKDSGAKHDVQMTRTLKY
jgi:hypothetical protein